MTKIPLNPPFVKGGDNRKSNVFRIPLFAKEGEVSGSEESQPKTKPPPK